MIANFFRVVRAVVSKDLLLELRTKEALPMSGAFALLIIVVFGFTFEGNPDPNSALWVAFVFAGTLGVTQSIDTEMQNQAIDGLILAPVENTAVYIGKVISSTIFVTLVGAISFGAIIVFLGAPVDVSRIPFILFVIFVSSIGFSAVAVIVSVIAAMANISGLLLPVLLVPLVVPVLLAGVELTTGSSGSWFTILISYDIITVLTGTLVFDELVW